MHVVERSLAEGTVFVSDHDIYRDMYRSDCDREGQLNDMFRGEILIVGGTWIIYRSKRNDNNFI